MVIFDCDGVLVDGEYLSTCIMAQEARKYGWDITDEQANKLFTGGELAKIRDRIAHESGRTLPDDWDMQVQNRIVTMMKTDAQTVDGAEDMLKATLDLGLPVRIGSNSSMAEMDAKFSSTGLDRMLDEDRIHSGRDLNMPKPRPDLYLYAAEQDNIPPGNCIVLEDSDAGAEAARRAGMACVLLRDLSRPAPEWPGLIRIGHLSEFVPLLQRIRAEQKQAAA
ncbi:HAD family phosphatase [Komagataeibacter diospyri]|uniref:Phosphatase n=1 Tax=Komagataeibacter diospyri TaxID=1932662 RepID=A0A4P5P339_9PROT|nr:HAD family phosphatase [Komagataeibacter diospyri]GCE84576.1 phosphatase [Komagataeibacter diospyri]